MIDSCKLCSKPLKTLSCVLMLFLFLLKGSKVNAQAFNGESVLMDAAGSGNTDCIHLLLKHGANPNLAGITGLLPIHKAAFEGHYE